MDLRCKLLIFLLSATPVFAQTGTINVDQNHTGHKIYGLPTPIASDEAATKGYADSHGGGGGTPIPGPTGPPGPAGSPGPSGSPGVGVPTGGTAAQVLSKIDATDYNTQWSTLSAGGNVSNIGTPIDNRVAVWTDATHIEGTGNLTYDGSTLILDAPIISAVTGFRINGNAANGKILRGDATNFIPTTAGYPNTAGTSGNVLTSDGTNWTSAAPTTYEVPLTFSQSVSRVTNTVTLSGDSASPGNTMLYGTNGSGTKGWYAQPAAGGGGNVSNTGTPANNQVAIWTNATTIEGDTGLTYTGTGTSALLDIGGTDLGLARNTAGVLEINNGTAGQFGGLKIGTRDASANTTPDTLSISHVLTTGTPAPAFGASIAFNLDSTTTPNTPAGRLGVSWSTPTHASRNAYMSGFLEQAGSGSPVEVLRLWGNGGLCLGTGLVTTDPGGSAVNCAGILINNASSTQGKFMQSTSGTTFVSSTYTLPTSAGAAGYTFRSDGTNAASFPAQLINSSTTSQSPSTSDVYLAGSNIVVSAGDMKVKGQYKCVFDMTKSAGTGAIVITLRVGTAGTTSDAAIQTYTFGAGTSVADIGIFEVIATWRTVGSGTSAVMQGICRGTHTLATTGLFNNAAGWVVIGSPSPSSGFNSSTATNIGLSFNGSTAFAGTTQVVQAQLQQ